MGVNHNHKWIILPYGDISDSISANTTFTRRFNSRTRARSVLARRV